MEQKYIPIVYKIAALIFFIGGVVCFCYSVNRLYTVYVLSKSDDLEEAIITKKIVSVRSFENAIYFSLKSEGKTGKIYRINIINISSGNIKINQKVNIVFNEPPRPEG
jgi:hypothetical protein